MLASYQDLLFEKQKPTRREEKASKWPLKGSDFQVAPLGRPNDDPQRSVIFQQQAIQVKGDYAQQTTQLAQGNSWVDVGWFQ